MKKNLSAEVNCHIKHSKRDMIIELLLIALTMIALCAVIAWMHSHPEVIK